jgi:hypothetical protein
MKQLSVLTAAFMLFSLFVKAQPVPIVYGATPEGNLTWYRHVGYVTGSAIPQGKMVGHGGWQQYKFVFANGNILYGVTKEGNLNWYKYSNSQTGSTLTLDLHK